MKKVSEFDWSHIHNSLNERGFAEMPAMLTPQECTALVDLYKHDELFRSTINMQRYRFGMGEYRYFNYPLPEILPGLRSAIYSHLVPVANEWMEKMNSDIVFPSALDAFLKRCHENGQRRATPLILRYETGGYNTLHQDLYGDVFFPFQVVFMLSDPNTDYKGGELVFVEQLPRAQSRSSVLRPSLGDAVVFTTNFRPIRGSRGYYRGRMKHGVSTVHGGTRYTMGLIFHDAA